MLLFIEIVVILVVGALLYEIARVLGLLARSLKMTRSMRPYERKDPNAPQRVLLVGDSTGYGTGTTDPRYSITGRIAADYPDAHIENWSETGSKLGYISNKLRKRPVEAPFDLVIIMAGGMHIVHSTSMPSIREQLVDVIRQARRHSRAVLLVAPHNAGLVPMFRPPFSWRNLRRAQEVTRVFVEVCAEQDVPLVSLLNTNDELAARNLYSRDKTHPIDEGYRVWYEAMQPTIYALLGERNIQRSAAMAASSRMNATSGRA
ncbi:MAG: GDSL-type esterase/lipase family protein [bacterium]|nr:GDSL-type esterase/lipase family protein [bacterium]